MGHNAGHADCFDCKCLLYFVCELSLVSLVRVPILAIIVPFSSAQGRGLYGRRLVNMYISCTALLCPSPIRRSSRTESVHYKTISRSYGTPLMKVMNGLRQCDSVITIYYVFQCKLLLYVTLLLEMRE